jgi:hypothetical protein
MLNRKKLLQAGMPLAIAYLLLSAHHAGASLGGSIDSIESDRKAFEGKLRSFSPSGSPSGTSSGPQRQFTIHEISQDGTKIQEYALPDGTVFAVSWRGPTQPDLSVLLGNYYSEYEQTLLKLNRPSGRTAQRRGRSSRIIRSKNLVIERSGHMRDVRGKAYLPDLMPTGLKAEDLHE